MGRRFLTLGAGEAVARLVAFGATVIVARRLGAESYGVVAFASAILLYFTYIAELGVETLGVRDIAEQPARLAAIVPSLVAIRLWIAAVLVVVGGALALLLLPQPDGAVLAVALLQLFPTAFSVRWVHLGLDRPGGVALARTAGEVVMAVLVVSLVHGGGDVARVPLAQFAGDALAALVMLGLLRRAGHLLAAGLDAAVARSMVHRSWPLVLHSMLGLIIFNADFVFLRVLRGASTVGMYAAAYTLVSFLLNLGVAYGASLLPALTRAANDRDGRQQLYFGAMAHVFAVGLPIAVGGTLVAGRIINLVFGASFAPSALALQLLLWSIPVALVRNVSQAALVAAGRQRDVLRTAVWAAVINLALNALIIPVYGMAGAAVSTLVTETVRTTLAVRYAGWTGVVLPGPTRFWRSLLAAGVMAGALLLMDRWPGPAAVAGGAAVYALALAVTGGLRILAGRPTLTV